ncbi:MAG: methyl-accepting chemotaxis protein [Synergistaceae bacterium]|nr:methyl-accepting chemotaxis protein [Synergistaceae bacterium]
MWRNFKINFKLLIGFGLLLIVFVLAVCVTWRYTMITRGRSVFLAKEVVPAMIETTQLERSTYELFMAMRQMRYEESEELSQTVKSGMAEVRSVLDDIKQLGVTYPEMQTPKRVAENFTPAYDSYSKTVEQSMAASVKKTQNWAGLVKVGDDMTNVANDVIKALFVGMDKAIEAGDQTEQKARMDWIRSGVEVADTVQTLRRNVQKSMVESDIKGMEGTIELLNAIEKNCAYLTSIATTPQNRDLVKKMNDAIELYKTYLSDYIEAFKYVDNQNTVRRPLMVTLNDQGTEVTKFAQNTVESIAEETVANLDQAIFILICATVIAVIMGVAIAIFISRSIAKPLSTIVALSKRAGEGDLTVARGDFHYEGKDELGVLANGISAMISMQEGALQEVVSVASNLAESAGSLSAISEETNASMEEVKASIDQVSALSENNSAALEECNAGVEEMSAGADTVAQSSTDSAAFISQTTEASNKAIQTVNSVIEGMRNVDKNSKTSEEKIRNLVSSVENVSSFVSVITGIADQTNLLALNAAIEAARAGEVGRGFAVVAEEVRKLAEESARAAQNVNGIIVELQNGAQSSIEATTDAGRMLGETLTRAEQAQKELDSALKEINKANDSIQNIAAVAEEQAASSKEVASAIDKATKSTMEMVQTISHIRGASEETAKSAQGVAEQSEAMNQHSQTLMGILSRFRLRTTAAAAAPKAKSVVAAAVPGAAKSR